MMKKIKSIIYCSFLLLGGGNNLWAQNSIVTTGGDGSGSGGTVNYSIGQVNYITVSGGGGITTQGVQQPFEILTIGIDIPEISLTASVYPNPADNQLILDIQLADKSELNYLLTDARGSVLDSRKISGPLTEVKMTSYASGAYLLKIQDEKETLKTFKIIKN